MNVAIVGLGYVGLISAVCLAKLGHKVYGMDINSERINSLQKGHIPIYEAGLKEIFEEVKDNILFTSNINEALRKSEVCFVCVGTPSKRDGKIDLKYIEESAKAIGMALKESEKYIYIAYRSTIPPGTSKELIIPLIENLSGKQYKKDFGYAFNPEFLREGKAIDDFFNPPKIIIGTEDNKAYDFLSEFYRDLPSKKYRLNLTAAEMVKYIDNSWHAVKIAFANEIGFISKQYGIDGKLLMDIFRQDTKLNISATYLSPGFAFGGSCLPKDVKGLINLSEKYNIKSPLLTNVIHSNQSHIKKAAKLIVDNTENGECIIISGVAFKHGTGDVRESPSVYLARELITADRKVKFFDKYAGLKDIEDYFGKDFIEINEKNFLKSFNDIANYRNIVFSGSYIPSTEKELNMLVNKKIFDLNGIFYKNFFIEKNNEYYGICW